MTTYTQLIADVQAYANRDDARLLAQLPSLISQAEQRITLDLQTLDSKINIGALDVVSANFSVGGDVIVKPARLKQVVSFNYDGGTVAERRTPIHRRSYNFCRRYWPDPAATGAPRYYADYDNEHFLIVRTPDDDYPFELIYYAAVEPLSETNQTNWLSDHYPGVLLYATLLEAQPFLKRDERVQLWQAAYTNGLQNMGAEQKRREDELR